MFRIYADVETTGFCPIRNDIVSIAIVIADSDFNVVSELYETVKPEFNQFYSDDAENIHGFSKKDLQSFQSPFDCSMKVLQFLKPFKDKDNFPRLFVYHALRQFDFLFLEWFFIKLNLQYSLYKIIRGDFTRSTIKVGRTKGYKRNGLKDWAERIDIDLEHHNALSDTRACLEIDKFLSKDL
jgi:DNA polymerase III epsilon subunit-like protein